MIEIFSGENVDLNKWQDLLHSSPVASFFQTKECFDFYSQLTFLKPFLFAVSENNKLTGLVCGYVIADGGLLKRFFSKRAIVPGSLLLDKDISENALDALLSKLKLDLMRKSIYIELRNYNDYSIFRSKIEKAGFIYQSHLNFHIQTPDKESVLLKFSSTKRRDVKLSIKLGAEIERASNKEDVHEFYKILKHLYNAKIKTPLFPVEFFEKVVQSSAGRLFVVRYKNKIIGGSVCVALPGNTLHEWFVCGLDGEFKNIYPSTLATWAAIEYATENGFKKFDMMGAGKPDEGYGVREFKSKFGGELVEHGRFLYISNRLMYSLGKFVVNQLRKQNLIQNK